MRKKDQGAALGADVVDYDAFFVGMGFHLYVTSGAKRRFSFVGH
jgi:hypothetical protein